MEKKRRVLLKLSGEALSGAKGATGFDEATVRKVGEQIQKAAAEGIEIAIVIGGGNFWRGRSSNAINRVKADQIGMLATVMNALYVSSLFESMGMKTAAYSSFEIPGMMPVFSYDAAEKSLSEGRIVFFAGGTGHPYFSTDTGVVLRAIEMQADEILLAKAIDGVYDKDPGKNPDAKKLDTITIEEMVEKRLKVIDIAASALCVENRMPMSVFALNEENSIYKALKGDINGTRITV